MNAQTPLDSLIEFARGQRDDALGRLAASLGQTREARQRLELLVGYRTDYAGRFSSLVRSGTTVAQLRNFRLFLDKLEQAICQQEVAVRSQAEREHRERDAWRSRESRLQGFSALRARRGAVAALDARRKEQKETDAHAARIPDQEVHK